MDLKECSHLKLLEANNLMDRMNDETNKNKVRNAICVVCKQSSSLHICLKCMCFLCNTHVQEHAFQLKHNLSIKLENGQLYCASCNIYNNVSTVNKTDAPICSLSEQLLQDDFFLKLKPNSGNIEANVMVTLKNLLTSTSFITCVMESLLHTPALREYFLSGRHKCHVDSSLCIACYVSFLFDEFYWGTKPKPINVDKLLFLIWRNANHSSALEQHDPYSFLMVILDLLHQDSYIPPMLKQAAISLHLHSICKCPCIVDKLFTGVLQMDVVCLNCSKILRTLVAARGCSLDTSPALLGKTSPTLIDCFQYFTRVEDIGSDVMCFSCNSCQESTKCLTINRLPPVFSIHLKGYQQIGVQKMYTSISFPEKLDMTPFLSSKQTESSEVSFDNQYSLFAVVSHTRKLFSCGSYIAYVQLKKGYWYRVDDYNITKTNLGEVLNSRAYILFYQTLNL